MSSAMRIYVGTYGKYNSGSIHGAWLDLADYIDKNDFLEAAEVLHADEIEETGECELMFQDWEGIPKGMIGESHIDSEVWDLIAAYDEHGEGAVNAYCSLFGAWDESDFQDRYRGEYSSDAAMCGEFADETGMLNEVPENLRYYFDWERYARDVMMSDVCAEDGHYFWNH